MYFHSLKTAVGNFAVFKVIAQNFGQSVVYIVGVIKIVAVIPASAGEIVVFYAVIYKNAVFVVKKTQVIVAFVVRRPRPVKITFWPFSSISEL